MRLVIWSMLGNVFYCGQVLRIRQPDGGHSELHFPETLTASGLFWTKFHTE